MQFGEKTPPYSNGISSMVNLKGGGTSSNRKTTRQALHSSSGNKLMNYVVEKLDTPSFIRVGVAFNR